ncbi:MAG: hypothetical protein V4773_29770 [Verrucomicrobiota bacterium]
MALKTKGKFSYGDAQADIHLELKDYAQQNGYPTSHFADAVCLCGQRLFRLLVDDNEGAAVRECVACKKSHPIGDSGDFLEDATLSECECPCGSVSFEISVGVALYKTSEDVRWIYIGCRCPACQLTACYADWKNEFEGYKALLARV